MPHQYTITVFPHPTEKKKFTYQLLVTAHPCKLSVTADAMAMYAVFGASFPRPLPLLDQKPKRAHIWSRRLLAVAGRQHNCKLTWHDMTLPPGGRRYLQGRRQSRRRIARSRTVACILASLASLSSVAYQHPGKVMPTLQHPSNLPTFCSPLPSSGHTGPFTPETLCLPSDAGTCKKYGSPERMTRPFIGLPCPTCRAEVPSLSKSSQRVRGCPSSFHCLSNPPQYLLNYRNPTIIPPPYAPQLHRSSWALLSTFEIISQRKIPRVSSIYPSRVRLHFRIQLVLANTAQILYQPYRACSLQVQTSLQV